MAFAPISGKDNVIGRFIEKTFGNFFEFSEPTSDNPVWNDYPTRVWVGSGEYRWAKVLKTVAYIVTDEDAEGKPVVERWHIRGMKEYEKQEDTLREYIILLTALLLPDNAIAAKCNPAIDFMHKWNLSEQSVLLETTDETTKEPVFVFEVDSLPEEQRIAIVWIDTNSCVADAKFTSVRSSDIVLEEEVYDRNNQPRYKDMGR